VQVLPDFEGFDWDAGNRDKNWRRHNVAWWECEEIFFNQPLLFLPDPKHSGAEPRFYALGITSLGRPLLVVFTRRKKGIRVISAREMSKKERRFFREEAEKSAKA
jgi:uncharacterized DUF497 family protein